MATAPKSKFISKNGHEQLLQDFYNNSGDDEDTLNEKAMTYFAYFYFFLLMPAKKLAKFCNLYCFLIFSSRTKIVPSFSTLSFFNQKISFGEFASLKPRFFEKISQKKADIRKMNMNKWNQNLYLVNVLCFA